MNHTIISKSHEETFELGQKIGSAIKNGIAIFLYGKLGSGKTCFVQGLGKGLKIPDKYYITSPTYTLINEYTGNFRLFHVDLYRTESEDDLEAIGFYELFDDKENKNIIAIEWSERLKEKFLNEYLKVTFDIISENSRKIELKGFGRKAELLIENIKGIK